MNLSCKCGKFGEMQVNNEADSAKFGSVMIVCRFCGRKTWWHLGKNLQQSCLTAMEDWERVQEKKEEKDE